MSTIYWRLVRRHCLICALLDITACRPVHYRLSSRPHSLPGRPHRPGGALPAQLTKRALWRSSDDKFTSATAPTRLRLLPASAPTLMINGSRSSTATRGICFTLSCPPSRDDPYELRDRSDHNFQLPLRSTAIRDCNFVMRLL
jgi:hypothetical protein